MRVLRGSLRTNTGAALGAASAFACLTVLVLLHVTDSADLAVRSVARPHEVWGPTQVTADYIVEGLRPTALVGPITVVTALVCAVRWSLRPAVLVAAVGVVTGALTYGLKVFVSRPDAHGELSHGGSYPSGHTISLVVVCGLAVLLADSRPHWWAWSVPATAGTVMASSLVLQGAHWASDVVGGGLLAVVLLTAVTALDGGHWAEGTGRKRCPRDRLAA